MKKNDNLKKIALAGAIAIGAVASAVVLTAAIKNQIEKKKLGGRLIRVNYKFSKEFDD